MKADSQEQQDVLLPTSEIEDSTVDHLVVPKSTGYVSIINKHRRAGSTGTTGDESTTTDEDVIENNKDEVDFKETNGIYEYEDEIKDEIKLDENLEELLDNGVSKNLNAAFTRLQNELKDAHEELKLKDEEVVKLTRIRQDVESELEELTASLFQEAHGMVREANEQKSAAEKALRESKMQVEVLQAEVAALKTLVLTSTPSRPNPHLHPHIKTEDSGVTLFNRKHRRSPSHFNLKYGRENSPPDSPVKEHTGSLVLGSEVVEPKDGLEVDPVLHKEFLSWKSNPTLEKSDPFINRVYEEDIRLCLEFPNKELTERLIGAVENGTVFIEAVSDKSKTMFPKRCALLDVPRLCFYRMKLGDQDTWYSISQICRNRITAVCDFFNYLRYIQRGLVKSSVHDCYWEIARLRKEMVLARLGLQTI